MQQKLWEERYDTCRSIVLLFFGLVLLLANWLLAVGTGLFEGSKFESFSLFTRQNLSDVCFSKDVARAFLGAPIC